jgi:hypothetical protein
MRQKDIALILIIVFISAVVSLVISKSIFSSPKNREQQVEVVQPITADFPQPDSRYFNTSSFDPTQVINVGQNSNTNPFNGGSSTQ